MASTEFDVSDVRGSLIAGEIHNFLTGKLGEDGCPDLFGATSVCHELALQLLRTGMITSSSLVKGPGWTDVPREGFDQERALREAREAGYAQGWDDGIGSAEAGQ